MRFLNDIHKYQELRIPSMLVQADTLKKMGNYYET